MTKILIIGSKGMAGHMIYNYFKENSNFEILDIARDADIHTPSYLMDVTDFKLLEKVLTSAAPNFVINCIGILNRDAEENPDKAILLNSYFPHFLARTGKNIGFKLIHISTDCVFNGKTGGYTEESVKDGIGFYAQSKAMGEVSYDNHLTLRTSIIGPELKSAGIGLFNWFMQQKGTIRGYGQAYWSGVTTLQLSKTLIEIITEDNLRGLVHLTNNEKINKYDLLMVFEDAFKRNLVLELFSDYKVDKSLINTRNDVHLKVPSYEQMIKEMKNWIESHPALYHQYDEIR